MTAFDYVILALIVLSALIGLWRGVIREIFALGAWVVGLGAMVYYGPALATKLPFVEENGLLQSLAGYGLVFVGVFIGLSILGFLVTKLIGAAGLSFIDRALGMVFGVLRGVLIAALLVMVLGETGLSSTESWKTSVSARPLEAVAAVLRNKLAEEMSTRVKTTNHGSDQVTEGAKLCVA